MNNIIESPIVDEIEQSFLDYSLSVITDRAIPAVEDGMKPVMRRILYSMLDSGYKSDKQYVKCARPVGDCMGKFHPHGDSSIYGALIGASQPWNMRYPLIDFHGNNGSRDGDGPAAMRYTECRLSKIAEATLDGIKKDCIDWIPNFDETTEEPVYLPGIFPNLLCNGTTGIAVAMACSFAPHNIGEVMDAAIAYLKNPNIEPKQLLTYIKGPDFPTGGTVINQKELENAYLTGKGRARIRGDYVIEKNKKNDILVFTSIPYKISKENLQQEIDSLCEEGKLEGVKEIRDESNKEGVRFVIELLPGINGDVIANKLYNLTDLETTYSYNQVALVNKTPRQLTLKDIIKYYIEHQQDVYLRKQKKLAKELEDRIEILNGLSKALANIDEIVKIIRNAENKITARLDLIKHYAFTQKQADAILDMKLSRLAHMESIGIQDELSDKQDQLTFVNKRINDENYRNACLSDELEIFKAKFADKRRTIITNIEQTKEEKEVSEIVPEDVVVIVTDAGNIKRVPKKNFRAQKRNGKGIKTQDDITMATIDTNTIDILLIFTNKGKVYRLGVDQVPEGTQLTRGNALQTLIQMLPNEKCVAIASTARNENTHKFVWFVTANGLIKKTSLEEYIGSKRKTGVQALVLREGDSLISVWIEDNTDILIITQKGMGIKFNGASIGPTGRTSTGVQGIRLDNNDCVVSAFSCKSTGSSTDNDANSLVAIGYADGSGKICLSHDFTRQQRAGRGVKISCGTSYITTAIGNLDKTDNLFISGNLNAICVKVEDIPLGSRTSTPIKLIKDSNIIDITKI